MSEREGQIAESVGHHKTAQGEKIMSTGCSICHRSEWGCLIPKSKRAAKRPMIISVKEEIMRGPCEPDYKRLKTMTVCIDCRPIVQQKLFEFLEGLKNERNKASAG